MYYVYPPAFTLNSSGTTITARYTISLSASLTSPPGMRPMTSTNYAPMGAQTFNQEKQQLDFSGTADTSYEPQQRSYQVGYAITSGVNYSPPTFPAQSDCVAVGPLLPMRYRVSGQNNWTVPTITQTELVAAFPLPSQPSTFWPVFKIVNTVGMTGYTEGQWYGSTNNYILPAAGGTPYDTTAYGIWYSASVNISASGGASVGNTSRLTITAPDSLRTLTASDFIVSGGTISNFTRVS